MSFIEELKRRNVFRVGIAYVIASWLLMQATDLIFPRIGLEDSAVTLVFALLGIGFIPALIFAWAFELTPDGIKKEKDVDRSESVTHNTGRKMDFLIIGVMAVALGYFVLDKFVFQPDSTETATADVAQMEDGSAEETTLADDKSIAVLPFVNMSADADNEYFSDGISEEILNALAKVKELKVAGRTSSFAFKGDNSDLREIGEMLGVAHILEGSVRKEDNQIRITAQLIQVKDGFHLWSESYDRELNNVFAIQDEIATAILNELTSTLLEDDEIVVSATRTSNEAYDLYLLAKQRMNERNIVNLQSAADLLDRAIAIDPDYAPAYAQRGIAEMLLSETSYGTTPQDVSLPRTKTYVDKALELDENLAEAWAALGLYYNGPPLQAAKSIEALEKALSINPNLNNAANWLQLAYLEVNRVTDSLILLDGIVDRDPLYKPALGNRTLLLAWTKRADEAKANIEDLEPFFLEGDPTLHGNRAWIDDAEGKSASSLTLHKKALSIEPNDRTNRVGVNRGLFLTHQFDLVSDDSWSPFYVWALFNLERNEEATLVAQRRARDGKVRPLFSLLNATDQSAALVEYFEQRWDNLESFQKDVPASWLGYYEMADVAFAYRKTGNTERFEEAVKILGEATRSTVEQGLHNRRILAVKAIYHALAGEQEQSLEALSMAVELGFVSSTRISRQYPYFREFDGQPEYEAIQERMIERLNDERAQLGLEPISS